MEGPRSAGSDIGTRAGAGDGEGVKARSLPVECGASQLSVLSGPRDDGWLHLVKYAFRQVRNICGRLRRSGGDEGNQ